MEPTKPFFLDTANPIRTPRNLIFLEEKKRKTERNLTKKKEMGGYLRGDEVAASAEGGQSNSLLRPLGT